MKWCAVVVLAIVMMVIVGCGNEVTPAGTRFAVVEEAWLEGSEYTPDEWSGPPIGWTVGFDDGTEEAISRCGIEGTPTAGHYYELYNNGEETYWREVPE